MKEYIIDDTTVALYKKERDTVIYNVDKYEVFNIPIKKIIEFNCLIHGSSMNGRIKSAKTILNIQYKVPILISEAENIILLQMNSLRYKECLFIVANKIIDYEEKDDFLQIKCINNITFDVKISKYSFEKLLIYTIKLNNYLKWSKTVNLV